jgi:hypothetical protein
MKRTHLFGTAMACTLAAAVSVGAQERPTTAPSDQSKTVVVTGCLKSGPAAASSTTGTTGTTGTAGTAGVTASASARGSFIVTDAVVKDTTTTATTPTTGATGTSGTSASATTPGGPAGKTYSLIGGQPSELQELLNSKVEIRGTLDAKDKAPAGSTASAPTTSTPPTAGASMAGMSHSDHPQLRVTSVTKLEGSCSGQ